MLENKITNEILVAVLEVLADLFISRAFSLCSEDTRMCWVSPKISREKFVDAVLVAVFLSVLHS
eukprot:jgi/Bigna1/63200/fgenesh1_kg.48_\